MHSKLALWEGMCCGCDHRSCPVHNGADSKHARCMHVHASDTTHVRTMVEALQLSGQVTSFQVPSEIMGSIVKVCPGFITPMVLFSAGSSGAGGGLLL